MWNPRTSHIWQVSSKYQGWEPASATAAPLSAARSAVAPLQSPTGSRNHPLCTLPAHGSPCQSSAGSPEAEVNDVPVLAGWPGPFLMPPALMREIDPPIGTCMLHMHPSSLNQERHGSFARPESPNALSLTPPQTSFRMDAATTSRVAQSAMQLNFTIESPESDSSGTSASSSSGEAMEDFGDSALKNILSPAHSVNLALKTTDPNEKQPQIGRIVLADLRNNDVVSETRQDPSTFLNPMTRPFPPNLDQRVSGGLVSMPHRVALPDPETRSAWPSQSTFEEPSDCGDSQVGAAFLKVWRREHDHPESAFDSALFDSSSLIPSDGVTSHAQPSPLPPKPKLQQTVGDAALPRGGASATVPPRMPNHGKTLDTIVAKAIIAIVASLGNGPVEQGRIGNALSKEERVRAYIKEKHGSLINFLLSEEAKKWFDVTAGVNGCYYVDVVKEMRPVDIREKDTRTVVRGKFA